MAGDTLAGLTTRAARIHRLLRGLRLDELVQVLDEALKGILGKEIELTLENIHAGSAGKPATPPWAAKQVTPHLRNENADVIGVFYGKGVSFTGDLSSISRDDAARAVAELGGVPLIALTRRSDILVVGVSPGYKLNKAHRYCSSGQIIEIIDEPTFLRYLAGATHISEGRDQRIPNSEIQAAARSARSKSRSPLIDRPSLGVAVSHETDLLAEGQAIGGLTCRVCRGVWRRQPTPGRPPSTCPDCRASIEVK